MIDFVNGAVPDASFCPDGVTKVYGHPGKLNMMLHRGLLDLSAVSVMQVLEEPERYYICQDLCIAASGPVRSVFLFSRFPLQELKGRKIFLSGASKTSVNLARLILERYHQIYAHYTQQSENEAFSESLVQVAQSHDGLVLIGDWAQQALKTLPEFKAYDLGELWYELTGLPFVFAVWALQKPFAHRYPSLCQRVVSDLRRSVTLGLESASSLYSERYSHLTQQEFVEFLTKVMIYRPGLKEWEGLKRFAGELYAHGLIHSPDLPSFFS